MMTATEAITNNTVNSVVYNPFVYNELQVLAKEDPVFFAVCGYPGGTVIGNKKGCLSLNGVHIKLGTRFTFTEEFKEKDKKFMDRCLKSTGKKRTAKELQKKSKRK